MMWPQDTNKSLKCHRCVPNFATFRPNCINVRHAPEGIRRIACLQLGPNSFTFSPVRGHKRKTALPTHALHKRPHWDLPLFFLSFAMPHQVTSQCPHLKKQTYLSSALMVPMNLSLSVCRSSSQEQTLAPVYDGSFCALLHAANMLQGEADSLRTPSPWPLGKILLQSERR